MTDLRHAIPERRISLECPIVGGASALLSESLASGLEAQPSSGDIHMTLMYVGRPSEVFRAVLKAREGFAHRPLSADRFLQSLSAWLERSRSSLPRDSWAGGHSLVCLGDESPYAVALEVDRIAREVGDLHHYLVESFGTFLTDVLNVPDGNNLMRSESAFGYTGKSWIPHVTVARVPERFERLSIKRVHLELGPLRVRNGSSLPRPV